MSNLIQQKYVTLMIQYQLLKWQWLLAIQVLYFICANDYIWDDFRWLTSTYPYTVKSTKALKSYSRSRHNLSERKTFTNGIKEKKLNDILTMTNSNRITSITAH